MNRLGATSELFFWETCRWNIDQSLATPNACLIRSKMSTIQLPKGNEWRVSFSFTFFISWWEKESLTWGVQYSLEAWWLISQQFCQLFKKWKYHYPLQQASLCIGAEAKGEQGFINHAMFISTKQSSDTDQKLFKEKSYESEKNRCKVLLLQGV